MRNMNRSTHKRRIRATAVLAAAGLAVAACGGDGEDTDTAAGAEPATDDGSADGETASDEPSFDLSGQTLRITASPPGSLTVGSRYVFDRLEDWGAEVDVIELTTTTGIQAIVAGQSDAGTHGADEVVLGTAEGADVVAIGAPVSRMDYVLIASQEIESAEDLEGANIAMSGPAGFDTLLTRMTMEDVGLDPEGDASFVQIGGSGERAAALLTGNVQAATVFLEDWYEISQRTEELRLVKYMAELVPDFPSDVYFGSREFWDEHDDLATAMACANLEANALFVEGKDTYIEFASPLVPGATEEGIGNSYDAAMEIDMWPQTPEGILNLEGFEGLIDAMVETGDISQPVDASELVDTSYLEAAAEMGCGQA
jgi:NitT/TauT family transport system substrate-binding protein